MSDCAAQSSSSFWPRYPTRFVVSSVPPPSVNLRCLVNYAQAIIPRVLFWPQHTRGVKGTEGGGTSTASTTVGVVCASLDSPNKKLQDRDYRKRERFAVRPSLEELFADVSDKTTRNKRIYQAVRVHHYRLREVGDFVGLLYSSISMIAKRSSEPMKFSEGRCEPSIHQYPLRVCLPSSESCLLSACAFHAGR